MYFVLAGQLHAQQRLVKDNVPNCAAPFLLQRSAKFSCTLDHDWCGIIFPSEETCLLILESVASWPRTNRLQVSNLTPIDTQDQTC